MSIEKLTQFENRVCPVCGKKLHHCVACHKENAAICMEHCYENGRCEHQRVSDGQAHCAYQSSPSEMIERWMQGKRKEPSN